MNIKNRLKKGESTLCTFTECGNEIKEGDILGYGDNYPCVVLYNKFEATFDIIEFGYQSEENYLYRAHDMLCSTVPWKILGNIDTEFYHKLLKEVPNDFDYMKDIIEYYEDHKINYV